MKKLLSIALCAILFLPLRADEPQPIHSAAAGPILVAGATLGICIGEAAIFYVINYCKERHLRNPVVPIPTNAIPVYTTNTTIVTNVTVTTNWVTLPLHAAGDCDVAAYFANQCYDDPLEAALAPPEACAMTIAFVAGDVPRIEWEALTRPSGQPAIPLSDALSAWGLGPTNSWSMHQQPQEGPGPITRLGGVYSMHGDSGRVYALERSVDMQSWQQVIAVRGNDGERFVVVDVLPWAQGEFYRVTRQ